MIQSVLDTDYYKLTMQQAVLQHFPEAHATYQFRHRNPTHKFTPDICQEIREQIRDMADLALRPEEDEFLRTLPELKPAYIDYLRNYRFRPDQVNVEHRDGQLHLTVEGPWHRTILWEVPLLALVSEIYFRHHPDGWTARKLLDHAAQSAIDKARSLHHDHCRFSEFGTRRRRSFDVQRQVFVRIHKVARTSNVHLSCHFGTKPVGTMAHEWIMGVSAKDGIEHANRNALRRWAETYRGRLGIALTDTFGTPAFWPDFDHYYARLYDGVRQDSGDPTAFARDAVAHYRSLDIDPRSKTVLFSDGLTAESARTLHARFYDEIGTSFGIGTHLTNDFPGSPALQIVLKLTRIDGRPVVKLSDDPAKQSGDPHALKLARHILYNEPL